MFLKEIGSSAVKLYFVPSIEKLIYLVKKQEMIFMKEKLHYQ